MNILLVYPKMPDTFYAMEHFQRALGKKSGYPPLGLLTIAPLLPGSWNKKLADINLAPLSDEDLAWADYVFISAMNVQELSVRDIVAQCKRAGIKIVAGGPLFTHEYQRFPDIDHFVLNEAEITLPLFLKDLERGEPQAIYESKEFANVAESPIPAFELVNMENYLYAIVQYSRGCPYMCDFCDVTALFGRRPRTKSSEQIIKELEAIQRQSNVKLVLFADDNLIGNKKILKSDLLPALIEWRKKNKPTFYFATQLTINVVNDEELMQLLLEAGFRHVFIGIETPEEEALKVSRKNQNLKRNQLEDIHTLHKAGFIISGGFIVGFDTDTESVFQRQVDFIQASGIPLPIVNILKAPPGTELYDRMKREGRISRDFAFAEGETNLVPVMDEEALYKGFLQVTENIYTPQKSYERIINFLKTYQYPQTSYKVPTKLEKGDCGILLIVIRFFIQNPSYLKYFWKLGRWCIKNNRKYMDKALLYGLMIYQMHQTYLHIKENVEESIANLKIAKAV